MNLDSPAISQEAQFPWNKLCFVLSDRRPHTGIHDGNLHVYFTANDHSSVNCSLAFEIFSMENMAGEFDYLHIESVSLPHWDAKMVPNLVVLGMGYGTRSSYSKTYWTSPWGRRYPDLGPNVKVFGALDPSQLSAFYNAVDVFVNPTLRPQGLYLTLMEVMQCGKTVLTPNFASITGTVVVNEGLRYTRVCHKRWAMHIA
ncbi:hypothetical protein HHK36_005080 [Tetracentron sinense]|uniref:Uncharacterized protein n=1 Tax=Tetracentron sinense TaxID=13715 RepID=A0A835DQE9_TETSI|nr:hypothetical protein HHK36_005080 [Tetracentron sinense]